jgi:MoxR-like ATPase
VSIGYPDARNEMAMLESHDAVNPLDHVQAVADHSAVTTMAAITRGVYAAPAIKQYIVDIVTATRTESGLRLGASPRAALQLLAASKARAAMAARNHVLPDDVKALAVSVLAHRVILSTEARLSGRSAAEVTREVVSRTPVPAEARDAAPAREQAVRAPIHRN